MPAGESQKTVFSRYGNRAILNIFKAKSTLTHTTNNVYDNNNRRAYFNRGG
jgi:hypothetical protein